MPPAFRGQGYYFSDNVFCLGGTGILIKLDAKFFLLTCQHVIDANINIQELQNESPIFTHTFSNKIWKESHDLCHPIRVWRIGENIKENSVPPTIDHEDIVLLELGFNLAIPDEFIDLDRRRPIKIACFNKTRGTEHVMLVGYPIEQNLVNYEESGDFNHSTVLAREITAGRLVKNKKDIFVRMIFTFDSKLLNGMSGGAAITITPNKNHSEWLGMIQKGSNGIVHIYPADIIIPAIKNYLKCSCYTLDPVANHSDPKFQAHPSVVRSVNSLIRPLQKNGNTATSRLSA